MVLVGLGGLIGGSTSNQLMEEARIVLLGLSVLISVVVIFLRSAV